MNNVIGYASNRPKNDDQPAFLYSLWSGRLIAYLGNVRKFSPDAHCQAVFITISTGKGYQCANQQGVVFNGVVWLEVENRLRAIELLIAQETKEIERHVEIIKNHQNKISILLNAQMELTE